MLVWPGLYSSFAISRWTILLQGALQLLVKCNDWKHYTFKVSLCGYLTLWQDFWFEEADWPVAWGYSWCSRQTADTVRKSSLSDLWQLETQWLNIIVQAIRKQQQYCFCYKGQSMKLTKAVLFGAGKSGRGPPTDCFLWFEDSGNV